MSITNEHITKLVTAHGKLRTFFDNPTIWHAPTVQKVANDAIGEIAEVVGQLMGEQDRENMEKMPHWALPFDSTLPLDGAKFMNRRGEVAWSVKFRGKEYKNYPYQYQVGGLLVMVDMFGHHVTGSNSEFDLFRINQQEADFNPPEHEKRNLEMLRDQTTQNAYDDETQN